LRAPSTFRMPRQFRYRAGEIVRVGDRVRSVGGRAGGVKEILLPGTEVAKQFSCPDGGVMIMEDWEGVSSPRIFAVPGDYDWDDVALVERAA